MLAIWVRVKVKPEARQRFLQAIEVDAVGSERGEPGCLRFNVLRDRQYPNVSAAAGYWENKSAAPR